MEASQLSDWVQIVQGVLTIVAVSIGGFWAFYVFILGRSSTAHVRIRCQLKRATSVTNGKKVAAVAVTLENTGRTRVRKEACYVEVAPLAHGQAGRSDLRFVDVSPDPRYSVTSTAFEKVEALDGRRRGEGRPVRLGRIARLFDLRDGGGIQGTRVPWPSNQVLGVARNIGCGDDRGRR